MSRMGSRAYFALAMDGGLIRRCTGPRAPKAARDTFAYTDPRKDENVKMGTIHTRDLLGNYPQAQIADYLREIGDEGAADRMIARGRSGQRLRSWWGDDVWGYTGLLVGHIVAARVTGPCGRVARR
jgi:hypothetical protein